MISFAPGRRGRVSATGAVPCAAVALHVLFCLAACTSRWKPHETAMLAAPCQSDGQGRMAPGFLQRSLLRSAYRDGT